HLFKTDDRVRHKVDDELGKREVEHVVGERDLLRRRVAHVDIEIPLARCLDERFRWIDRCHVRSAEPGSELERKRTGPTADVERPPEGLDAREVCEKRCELPRKSPHEAFIGTRRREELTHAQSVGRRRVKSADERWAMMMEAAGIEPASAEAERSSGGESDLAG